MHSTTTQDRANVGPELAGALMSPGEFDAIDDWDDDYRYELINGVLVVTPIPSEGERGPNELLGHLLRQYQEQRGKGSSLNYTLAEHTFDTGGNRRRPDRVIWAGLGRVPNVHRDPPTIVVEFVSQGRRNRLRDYETKRDEYRAAGVREYWIIDRFQRRMTVIRQADSGQPQQIVQENETYITSLLPGFELPIARLFGEADMLDQAQRE